MRHSAHVSVSSLVAIVLSMTGCGIGDSSDDLAGTWSNTTCYGSTSTPADIEECSVSLTFTDALTMELQADWLSLPATAEHPGCTTTKLVTGHTWSTLEEKDYDVLAVAGEGTSTIERSGCVYDEDNMDPTGTSDISVPNGDVNYQISGDTLTILSSGLEGTYTQSSLL